MKVNVRQATPTGEGRDEAILEGGDHGWRQGRVAKWRCMVEGGIGVEEWMGCGWSAVARFGWSNPNHAPCLAALGEGRSVGAHERRRSS